MNSKTDDSKNMERLKNYYTLETVQGFSIEDTILVDTARPLLLNSTEIALGAVGLVSVVTESGKTYNFISKRWIYDNKDYDTQESIVPWLPTLTSIPTTTTTTTSSNDIADMLEERGSRYGVFSSHASITQDIKAAMKGLNNCPTNWENLSSSQKEALEMVAHKIGRILNGDPNYLDSWIDIVGYTQLVVDELKEPMKRAETI